MLNKIKKKFLITGGAGFIGSAVIRHIIDNTNHRVVNVDKLTYAGSLLSLGEFADHERHHFYQMDIVLFVGKVAYHLETLGNDTFKKIVRYLLGSKLLGKNG